MTGVSTRKARSSYKVEPKKEDMARWVEFCRLMFQRDPSAETPLSATGVSLELQQVADKKGVRFDV